MRDIISKLAVHLADIFASVWYHYVIEQIQLEKKLPVRQAQNDFIPNFEFMRN